MSTTYNIVQDISVNHWKGRKGYTPIAIVNHITAGKYPGCLSWMKNPNAKASSNYLVTQTGEIIQLVLDEDTAWANGGVKKPNWPCYISGVNPNLYTISIEHEGYDGTLTEAQYQATLWLHRYLVQKWGILIDADHIIGHYRIDSVNRPNCPGPNFPWQRLFADLKGGNAVPEWMQNIMNDAKRIGLITSDHVPTETASKWFVLACILNGIKYLKGGTL